ncbi:lipase 3 [Stomoxys calcitrans]|uniref:lipase 3 n=1 Tax=Stomoxys calcitrans TaxID=35570 RepID=UPI0027E2D7C3|nr:lipase 3 [Stomoxys calcitrans]
MQSLSGLVIVVLCGVTTAGALDTCDRITHYGYPCERHNLTTKDGYVLAIFRIPYSQHGDSYDNATSKPPVLLMHCLECSSDIWIISGPDNGLPFILADAGYDVWLGNARGNVYSQKHIKLQRSSTEFWEFSLDEIGIIDVPAKIDYVLAITNSQSLHYVGYSQGSTTLMMALASKPEYNEKLRSTHLLAPVVFLCYVGGPVAILGSPIVGSINPLTQLLGTVPLHELEALSRSVAPGLCQRAEFAELCLAFLNIVCGWGSPHLNRTLIPELLSTAPAGGSFRQVIHYAQMVMSCKFRPYDFGLPGNMQKYGKSQPPSYNLANVHPKTPIEMYFGENDYFVPLRDAYRLSKILGNRASWNHVKFPKYNHFDYTLASNVRWCINDCVVDRMQKYEGRSFHGDLCKCFKNKPF